MYVELISHSQGPSLFGDKDLAELVAYCARVSNPINQLNDEASEKILKYLIKHKHWSPFEMVSVCLQIDTTRDIARQILRHRRFSFQEFSQRYADPTEDLDFETRPLRLQDPTNRQNSIEFKPLSEQQIARAEWWQFIQEATIRDAKIHYKKALEKGIAKEVARAILPEGLTLSRLYVNGTLRSWIHYIELRRENGTQKEHMEIALKCAEVIRDLYPLI